MAIDAPVRGPRERCVAACAAGLVHGVLLVCAFAPVGAWPLAMLSVVPAAWLADRERTAPARRTWVVAACFSLGALPSYLWQEWWLFGVTPLGPIPLALYLSMYPAIVTAIAAGIARRRPRVPVVVIIPLLWSAGEILRTDAILTGYGWFLLGQPVPSAIGAEIVRVIGLAGLSFTCAVIGSGAWRITCPGRAVGRFGAFAAGAAALGISAGLGFRAAPAPERMLTVAVIQTNVPQDNKLSPKPQELFEAFRELAAMTREASASSPRPAIIVWPETMAPSIALDEASLAAERAAQLAYRWKKPDGSMAAMKTTDFADGIFALQAEVEIPLLVGDEAFENLRFTSLPQGGVDVAYDKRFNSAYLLRAGAVAQRYDKMSPTPFGEEIPYARYIPGLRDALTSFAAGGMKLDLDHGVTPTLFELAGADGAPVRFVTPICFEVVSPRVCRRLASSNPAGTPDLFINITNDGWFAWWDAGRRQHLQIAAWRAVEHGIPMVRASNTGISALISASGEVRASGSRTGEILHWDVALAGSGRRTLYARGGYVIEYAIPCVAAGVAVFAFVRRRTGA